jgi:hypothetical protein
MTEICVFVDEAMFNAAGEAQQRKLREYARRLREEPFLGDRIRKKQFPRRFRELPNLFRLELPGGWRALYTVASRPGRGTQVRVVWIGGHKGYERLFGY